MERHREPVAYRFDGPLPTKGLPQDVLYDAVLSFRHGAGADAPLAVKRAVVAVTGAARVRRFPFLPPRVLAAGPRWKITARVAEGGVQLRLHHRVKGNALARLVLALADVPGAHDLRIDAAQERYDKPYSSIGPCSPCAASRFPRGR